MQHEIKFTRVTQEHINYVSENMRKQDVDEVWASSRSTPLQALNESVAVSQFSVTVLIGEVPCCIAGLRYYDELSDYGSPWLLSSTDMIRHKRILLTESKLVLEEMLSIRSHLENYVHIGNTVSKRWLSYLGFTIAEEHEMGTGEIFNRFYIRG